MNTELHVSDIIGEWGRWQKNIFFFYLSTTVFSAFHNLGLTLMAPTVNFWCLDANKSALNITNKDACQAYKMQNSSCRSFGYDTSFFPNTVVTEWDLVCDRSWLVSFTQSSYMVGMIVSSLLFGQMSDKYGRLPILWTSVLLEIAAGLSCAFSFSVYQYTVSRFTLGIGAYGRFLTGFMLVLETTGTQYRSKMGILCRFGWALGYLVLPGVVWLFRSFRAIQLACTLSEILWVFWLLKIPESPRWQFVNGDIKKAEEEVRRAALTNGLSLRGVDDKIKQLREHFRKEQEINANVRKPNFFDLWKTPRLRLNTIVLCFTWFTTGYVYYGLSLNIGDFGGNLLLNFAIAGFLEFPSFGLSLYIMETFDRRTVQSAVMLSSAVGSLIAIPFYFFMANTSSNTFIVILIMIVKFAISVSYYTIYIYSAEVYPTSVRQVGVGSNSVASRIGSVVAPFVKELSLITHPTVTLGTFVALGAFNGFSIFLLPETKGRDIPDTIEEVEAMDIVMDENARNSICHSHAESNKLTPLLNGNGQD